MEHFDRIVFVDRQAVDAAIVYQFRDSQFETLNQTLQNKRSTFVYPLIDITIAGETNRDHAMFSGEVWRRVCSANFYRIAMHVSLVLKN